MNERFLSEGWKENANIHLCITFDFYEIYYKKMMQEIKRILIIFEVSLNICCRGVSEEQSSQIEFI